MHLLDHLRELRRRLIWVILGVGLGAIVGWIYYPTILAALIKPACPFLDECRLIVTSPLEAFNLRLKLAAFVGFVLSFPFVLFHVWRFVAPGLHRNERKWAVPFIGGGVLLFAIGIASAYYTLPTSLEFLIGPSITGPDVDALLRARDFVSFIQVYLLTFGITFQFPILLIALSLAGILPSATMKKYRRHVFMGIAVLMAVATPSVDLVTMGILTAAAYTLYEMTILIVRLLKR